MPLLQAALNGDREHPAVPRTPDELASDARASVDAGARVLHLHPYDGDARQTFEAEACAAAIRGARGLPGHPDLAEHLRGDRARSGAAPSAGGRLD